MATRANSGHESARAISTFLITRGHFSSSEEQPAAEQREPSRHRWVAIRARRGVTANPQPLDQEKNVERNRTGRWLKRIAVFLIVTIVALGIGAAFAAWTVNGGGSGTATATSALPLTTSVAATTAQLYPGISGANLYLTVNNPNPFPVTITSVNANGAAVPDPGHVAGCVTTGVTYSTQTTSQTVAANSSLSFTVPGVSMTNASDTGCQGATFTIPVTFTASS